MASFTEIRNLLLESFDDNNISEDEFVLLYDANTSKNPDFPYDCYGKFDLNEMDDSECLAEFRFHICFDATSLVLLSHLCFELLA